MIVHLYGHYDSRGGAIMFTGSREEADRRYGEFFCWTPDEEWPNPAINDFIGTYDVMVLDLPEHSSDLVYNGEGDIRLWTETEEHYEGPFFIGKRGPEGWVLAKHLGEDACGVLWNPEY